MSEIVRRMPSNLTLNFKAVPELLSAIIDTEGWVNAVLRKTPYIEPNPDFVSTMIAFQTITSQSVEEVFRNQGVKKVQEMIPNVPGATTGPIEITDLYVASSDFETGNPSYVIISAVSLDTGEEWKATTGATNVQATILGLLLNGMWPIKCQIKRGDSKDKGDRYLLFVLPPD